MRITKAKTLINEALTKKIGFKLSMNSEQTYYAVGVKTGQITPESAADKILESIKFTN